MKIITLNNLTEFQDFILEKIERNTYEYKYLINCLDLVFTYQELSIDIKSQILIDGYNWVIYIETPLNLFLYGLYDTILIDKLSETIDLKAYKGYEIMGDYDIVYYLITKSNLKNYKVIKDRLFYSREKINSIQENKSQLASIDDLDDLIFLHQEYYNEEYLGQRDKTEEFLRAGVLEKIENKKIFLIKDKQKIIAFCSIINPDIGILYTSTEHRSKGLAKQLLTTCTKKLLKDNKTAYLMTDMHNLQSNKVCKKVGYISYYRHTNLELS